jgi:predicted AlkP superfamily pyrophosphatase or phosphodiesterase
MLTGVTPEKHKVNWNAAQSPDKQGYPAVPTIFEIAKAHGISTGMASGKDKFVALAKAGTVDWCFISKGTSTDAQVAVEAEKIITEHQPQLMFVHLPGVDTAGHAFGWSSPQQMKAIAGADVALGAVLHAYEKAGLLDQTFIIMSADHGGAGLGHGANDPRSRFIPWLAAGPGVRVGYDLTILAPLVVGTEDTFATTSYMLGLPLDPNLDGKPVLQILSRRDLMSDRP